jgi:nitrogen regulatory protein P-II 1
MKLIVTILRPEQLPSVKRALFAAGLRNLTASTTMGTAPKSEQQKYRGVAREVSLFPRVRLELVVIDDNTEKAIKAITEGAKETGGWGRIFVTKLDDAVTIWTGDRGDDALS